MNAKPRYVYECQMCKNVYRDRIFAERCCKLSTCNYCGIPTGSYISACCSCAELARVKRAQHVPLEGYTDEMVCDGTDKYISTEDVEEYFVEGEITAPYVWGCDKTPLRLDIEDALETVLQDHYEGASFNNEDELIEFVEGWNKKQTDASFFPNNTVVVIDEARFSAMLLQFEFRAAMLA